MKKHLIGYSTLLVLLLLTAFVIYAQVHSHKEQSSWFSNFQLMQMGNTYYDIKNLKPDVLEGRLICDIATQARITKSYHDRVGHSFMSGDFRAQLDSEYESAMGLAKQIVGEKMIESEDYWKSQCVIEMGGNQREK